MKLLFDLFPVLLFFLAYMGGKRAPETASALVGGALMQFIGGDAVFVFGYQRFCPEMSSTNFLYFPCCRARNARARSSDGQMPLASPSAWDDFT